MPLSQPPADWNTLKNKPIVPSTNLGEIGSYLVAFVFVNNNTTTLPGTVFASSLLFRPAEPADGTNIDLSMIGLSGVTKTYVAMEVTGDWRLINRLKAAYVSSPGAYLAGLFVRVS